MLAIRLLVKAFAHNKINRFKCNCSMLALIFKNLICLRIANKKELTRHIEENPSEFEISRKIHQHYVYSNAYMFSQLMNKAALDISGEVLFSNWPIASSWNTNNIVYCIQCCEQRKQLYDSNQQEKEIWLIIRNNILTLLMHLLHLHSRPMQKFPIT